MQDGGEHSQCNTTQNMIYITKTCVNINKFAIRKQETKVYVYHTVTVNLQLQFSNYMNYRKDNW